MSRIVTTDVPNASYIEWGPVIAGSVIALAVTAIFIPFGNAIGFSVDAELTRENANGILFTIGLWILWTQLISTAIGSYIVGKTVSTRYAPDSYEGEFRDGAHGLLSWCLSTVLAGIGVGFAALVAAIAPEHVQKVAADPELVKRAGIIFGFIVAASSIVSAVAAWVVAGVGGDHRDNKTDLGNHMSFRRVRANKKKK